MDLIKVDLLSDLNKKQREAVKYFDSPLRIIAGAGSGKTRVLTRKIAYLINDLGVRPKNILAVTFTNKAANEMKQRVIQYTDKSLKNELKISTFHSFCAEFLRKHIRLLGYHNDFLIIDEPDKNQILGNIYRKLDISSHDISYKTMIEYISYAKNMELNYNDLCEELQREGHSKIIADVYQEYLNELTAKGSLDFDDLVILAKMLLETHPEITAIYQKQFEYILVDEFQDTSHLQYELIKLIIGPNTHFTIVGDPDQTIYNWRGADVNLILNFDKEFKDAKTIVLDINYRSTQKILDSANKLISQNTNRLHKDLVTSNEEGDDVEFYHGFSPEAEARWVIQKINELKKQKNQLKGMAILYRSNYYSRPFEEALIEENINHKIFNGTKFFERSEVKDALAFLRVIAEQKDIALERIINVPNRGIGDVTLGKLKEYAKKQGKSLFRTLHEDIKTLPIPASKIKESIYPFMVLVIKYAKALQNNKISVTLAKFLEDIKYFDHIALNENLRGSAEDNVKELINSIANWEEKNKDKTVTDYLNMVSLMSVSDEYDNVPNYVSLMTIHSAKGLEFDNIFLVGLSEGIFPNRRSLDNNGNKFSAKGRYSNTLEDERRLAYVAATRARSKLFLSDSRGKIIGTDIDKKPSRFITEMGLDIHETIISSKNGYISNFNDEEDNVSNSQILVGDIISHIMFGDGEVVDVTPSEIVVEFIKDKKTRTLNKNHPSIKVISK
ncbi:ATP-dependent helicase [Mycoplasmopsis verecunda]|uniref:DNA 3'-5' helicase n=1 Tax=Mycoplasmopsis verecunda TaxID=171291 RepID=A0A1T4KLT1_9BACT|nr:UvrD-helicase domain-containing protein [Mycoplasmopsis verecunda]WPB54289.1 UvrD-helicase domain-containing protein [Mycoplasmopsis verecunda]SJZ43355.1 DNA helicase-2 / ATP-dependent DNA helicase PcrA [Mycoplasmopsis verecunda]